MLRGDREPFRALRARFAGNVLGGPWSCVEHARKVLEVGLAIDPDDPRTQEEMRKLDEDG